MENWLNVAAPAVLLSCERENMPTSSVPLEPLRVAGTDLEDADNLCDVLVSVQEACGVVASADAEGFEVDAVVG